MTKHKTAQKNPFEKYPSTLNTHRGPPRRVPVHKYFMQHPKYKQSVHDEYQRRFGHSKEPVNNKPTEKDQPSRPSSPSHSNNLPNADSSGSRDEGEEVEKENDSGGEGREGSSDEEEEEDSKYALTHRVQVAKEMFARLSGSTRDRLKEELDKDHNEKKQRYERALRGEELYDPALLEE